MAKKGQKLGDKARREPRTGWTSRVGSPGYLLAKQQQPTNQTEVGNLRSSEPREAFSIHLQGLCLSSDEALQQKHHPRSGIQHKQAIPAKDLKETQGGVCVCVYRDTHFKPGEMAKAPSCKALPSSCSLQSLLTAPKTLLELMRDQGSQKDPAQGV